MKDNPLFTPDGRYLVVRGRLWRRSNPDLPEIVRQRLVDELMAARRGVRAREADARARIHAAKIALGERGPVWWADDSPDLTRRLAKNSPYAEWYAGHVTDS